LGRGKKTEEIVPFFSATALFAWSSYVLGDPLWDWVAENKPKKLSRFFSATALFAWNSYVLGDPPCNEYKIKFSPQESGLGRGKKTVAQKM
jgi:hypothetical protein